MGKQTIGTPKQYGAFLNEIKRRITTARINAARSVNRELIKLYWDIGGIIVARQKQHGWGQGVVRQLAADLAADFNNLEGFSANNLWRIRNFYLAYKDHPKLAQLVQEIPWGQNIVILQMVKDIEERAYYISASSEMGWSRNVLLNQIKAGAYQHQKTMPKQHNFPQALPAHLAEQADESLKSVYSLDFLDITKPVLERELERRLVEKVKRFMLELGKGFCFIGNQHRLTLNDNEYFVDMLFYNRILKCLVAIELKTGKFEIEHAAKMDFYLDLLNEQIKLDDENPSVGIILCVQKDSVVVEYALRRAINPMGVAEYRLAKKPTKELKAILPDERDLRDQLLLEMQTEIKSKKKDKSC
jgi:predicted nuclease of restriction endonuclease-like (RecB) superfamily